MGSEKFDVVILGGGNAAMGATVATRAAGLSVAMIESRDLGGTCPNRGCTPKKVLVAAAHALDEIGRASAHRIAVARPQLNWTELIAREKDMIRDIPTRLAGTMSKRGVDVIRGKAAFVGRNAVRVGDRTLEAKHIVIATGSKPRDLPIPGAERMITSDDVLNETTRPGEVVFVGGGVIAMEFAHVYARAGAKVTILEALPRLLGAMDIDAVEQIRHESERLGVRIVTDAAVARIDTAGRRLRVVFSHGGKEQAIEADRVVNGAGRVADVLSLDLDKGGVAHDRGRIAVDDYLRSTSNPAVFVCGDANPLSPQLSPIATYEGGIVGRNIVDGPKRRPDYSTIPACVYTIPAVASVGLTEAEARKNGARIKVHANDMSQWLSARTYAEPMAWSKIIVDEASDKILGAHMVGHSGEELIHIFALAMKHGITASALSETVFGFPTFSADIKSML